MSGDRISDEAVRVAVCNWFNDPTGNRLDLSMPETFDWPRRMRNALSAALPLLEGGKGEPVVWMVRNTDTGELHWDVEACVFADAGSANEMAECLNDGDPPIWEAFPLYTAPQPAAQQPAGGKWRERWEGSGPQRGWHIVKADRLCNNDHVTYLGESPTSEAVSKLVASHNATLRANSSLTLREVTHEDATDLAYAITTGASDLDALRAILPHGIPTTGSEGEGK